MFGKALDDNDPSLLPFDFSLLEKEMERKRMKEKGWKSKREKEGASGYEKPGIPQTDKYDPKINQIYLN